jgi:hypothetical protein
MPIQIVRKTKGGLDYIGTVLRDRKSVVTRAVFWRVPHRQTNKEDIGLKIGRYKRLNFNRETLQATDPKANSRSTTRNFGSFCNSFPKTMNRSGREKPNISRSMIHLITNNIKHLRAIFRSPNKQQLLQFIVEHSILPDDLLAAIQNQQRITAIGEFETMLRDDLREHDWQRWFSKNDWILGSDFVRVVDERAIDTENIADYLVQASDGFLDIIEIKRSGALYVFGHPLSITGIIFRRTIL